MASGCITSVAQIIDLWVSHILGDTGRISPKGYGRASRAIGSTKEAQAYGFVCDCNGYSEAKASLHRMFVTCKPRKGDREVVKQFRVKLAERLEKSPLRIVPMHAPDGHIESSIRIASDHGVVHRIRSIISV